MIHPKQASARTWIFSGAAAAGLLIGGVGIAAAATNAGSAPTSDAAPRDDQEAHIAGSITAPEGPENDGQQESEALQSLAQLTPDQARTAALTAATGAVGAIHLEDEDGFVVYSVEVGDQEVKIDAGTGAVLGVEALDGHDSPDEGEAEANSGTHHEGADADGDAQSEASEGNETD